MKAAAVAARKFGSNDPAVDEEDFASIAAERILKRDPSTIGCAVHVGREAIGEFIGRARYRNNSLETTVRWHRLEKETERRMASSRRGGVRTPEEKRIEFGRDMIRRIGRPDHLFGRFGVVYPDSVERSLNGVFFDQLCTINESRRKRRLLIHANRVETWILDLANSHYVLLLVPDGKKTTIATGVAGKQRQGTF
jgi:hypothetical protein